MRLVVPGWEGNMWVKWLRRNRGGRCPRGTTGKKPLKYTDLFADGQPRRFTWEMDAKSVITNPSPQAPITHGPGPTVLTGVAWSGRGTISRVDVTLDGGMNWHRARMSGPSLDKSMHRFYFEYRLGRQPVLLQSRAHDSTGYVQPTSTLREVRGRELVIYHNNGIQTWAINEAARRKMSKSVELMKTLTLSTALVAVTATLALAQENAAPSRDRRLRPRPRGAARGNRRLDIDIRPDGQACPWGPAMSGR